MRTDPRIHNYIKAFEPFNIAPHEIICEFKSPPAAYDFLHLDGIIAKAVVENALQGQQLEPSIEPYDIPLPFTKLWESEIGLPLWATTDLIPQGKNEIHPGYWHKRAPRPELLPRDRKGNFVNINTANGVNKEYRVPLPLHSAKVWRATFDGDAQVVSELVKKLPAIGKKRAQGYGLIKRWTINPIDWFSLFDVDERPLRPIPIQYITQGTPLEGLPVDDYTFTGWTPPYWKETNMALCVERKGD